MIDSIFSPAFGNKPKTLVGRNSVLATLVEGLSAPVGSKERARLLIGQRGMGKTVLLLELADYARNNNIITATPTVVSKGMLNRIIEKLSTELNKNFTKTVRVSGASIGILGFSAGIQTEVYTEDKSFAFKLEEICKKAKECKKSILILIDEVYSGSEELKELIITYQEMVGENYDISLILAGLPASISKTLNQHVLTFLNRASKLYLEPIPTSEIQIYYKNSFEKLGISITNSQIETLALKTEGSPYMMQLLGHYVTLSANNGEIKDAEFKRALTLAKNEFITDICETSLSLLSDRDIDFLKVMALDEENSSMSDICKRLNVDSAYANRYKGRLLQAGIISQKRRGYVEFAVPYLKDYLK